MCAISGIYAYRREAPPVDPLELLRVRDHMRARGPDGAGEWISDDRRIGLAHRRLAIIDLSPAGAQPMHDPETGNWIVFNGEIYNHDALRAQLNRDGVATRSRSDTEVLLKLYAQSGTAMLACLRGMYAFALWDARQRQLFMARDPFGIKPLYYADNGSTLRFASQVKALLQGPVDRRAEPAGHAGFLLWGSVPEPYTLFKGIRALPPGHWMQVTRTGATRPVCFDRPLHRLRQLPSAAAGAEQEALAQIADAVHDSVAAHMVADVPVGVFLSAGLDSTMLAASAARRGELRTLTLGFEEYKDGPFDEAALAAQVAQGLHARHSLHRICAADFAHDRARLVEAMDQPSIDGINTWFVAKAAAQQGLKVALSGIGGDELFGSYPSFRQVPRLRNALRGWSGPAWLGRGLRKAVTPWAQLLPSPKYAGVLEYGRTLGGAYLLRRALFMPWEIGTVMDPALAAEGLAELDVLRCLADSMAGITSDRLAVSALEMQWYMKNQLLRDADWAGMAHSLEIRVPFVDMALLSRCIQIPSLDAAQEKRMVARAVAPGLPQAILNRPKTGFSVPIHQWINADAPASVSNHRQWAGVLYRAFTQT